MRKLPPVPEEVLYKANDSFLEETIERYNHAVSKNDEEEAKEIILRMFDILSYRTIVLPLEVRFLDNKLKCAFRKGRLPTDIDIFNNEKIETSPIFAEIRKKGSNDPFIKYVSVLSSVRKLKDVSMYNTIYETTFRDVYEKYIKNSKEVEGICLNPCNDNFIFSKELCEIILYGSKETDWKKAAEEFYRK